MQFCGLGNGQAEETEVKEISVLELKDLLDKKADFQLIDVREPYEYEIANLGGELVPEKQIGDYAGKIARDKKVILHCRTGVRSKRAILELESKLALDNLYNLKGGVLAYADEVDPSLTKY